MSGRGGGVFAACGVRVVSYFKDSTEVPAQEKSIVLEPVSFILRVNEKLDIEAKLALVNSFSGG